MLKSFKIELNRENVFKAGEGAGKSGSFFFSTHDSKYLVKTMKCSEKQDFLEVLD